MPDSFAVIFDMDGTLMDNNPWHFEAWRCFCGKIGRDLDKSEYQMNISGKLNRDILQYLLGSQISPEDAIAFGEQKETLYRQLYTPHIKPLNGLLTLLEDLRKNRIPSGIATSALPENIRFAMDFLELTSFFDIIVDQTWIKKGKPDPEIFLLAANALQTPPAACLVFEDSISGIRGAVAAGMHPLGITTSCSPDQLVNAGAERCLADYEGLTTGVLRSFLH
jgi:beta-phosphoglucomutase